MHVIRWADQGQFAGARRCPSALPEASSRASADLALSVSAVPAYVVRGLPRMAYALIEHLVDGRSPKGTFATVDSTLAFSPKHRRLSQCGGPLTSNEWGYAMERMWYGRTGLRPPHRRGLTPPRPAARSCDQRRVRKKRFGEFPFSLLFATAGSVCWTPNTSGARRETSTSRTRCTSSCGRTRLSRCGRKRGRTRTERRMKDWCTERCGWRREVGRGARANCPSLVYCWRRAAGVGCWLAAPSLGVKHHRPGPRGN